MASSNISYRCLSWHHLISHIAVYHGIIQYLRSPFIMASSNIPDRRLFRLAKVSCQSQLHHITSNVALTTKSNHCISGMANCHGSSSIILTKAQAGKMSNMPKMAKSIPINAQEGYTPVCDKSPSRQNVKHAQDGKILIR